MSTPTPDTAQKGALDAAQLLGAAAAAATLGTTSTHVGWRLVG